MENHMYCKFCGAEVTVNTRICPKCGGPQKPHTALYVLCTIIGILVISSSIGVTWGAKKQPQPLPPQSGYQSVGSQDNSQPEEIVETDEPQVPREYLNALEQAKTYGELMHMSKQGIFDQLTSEYGGQFPAEAAQYAIDNLEIDYNENALETAKVYYEEMNMSKEDVRDQLTSAYGSRFTQDEADYAIEHLD